MMARQHVALGYAGYIATVSTLGGTNPMWRDAPHVAWMESMASPLSLVLASVIAGAFAIWPDIDHPGSTVSKKLGIIGAILSRFVRLFGGHRGISHTWVFVAVNALAVGMFVHFLPGIVGLFGGPAAFEVASEYGTRITLAVLLAVSALLITRLILPGNTGKGNAGAVVAAVLVALVALNPESKDFTWLPIAVAAGIFLHDVGDSLTTGGTKFFFPLPVKIALPLVGNTNSAIERLIAGPIFTFVNVLFTAKCVIYPMVPAIGTFMEGSFTISSAVMEKTIMVALIIAAFDCVTRVIAGKPQFSGH